jgi:hypothetical protein
MNKICLISIAVGVLAITGGCTSLVSVAPSTVPITANDTYTKLGRATGTSQSIIILGLFPFGSLTPSRAARNEAIESKRANALIEVTESFRLLNLLIVQYRWTTVEGTAIQFEQGGKEL